MSKVDNFAQPPGLPVSCLRRFIIGTTCSCRFRSPRHGDDLFWRASGDSLCPPPHVAICPRCAFSLSRDQVQNGKPSMTFTLLPPAAVQASALGSAAYSSQSPSPHRPASPSATISPPRTPPSGPKSTIQSAVRRLSASFASDKLRTGLMEDVHIHSAASIALSSIGCK